MKVNRRGFLATVSRSVTLLACTALQSMRTTAGTHKVFYASAYKDSQSQYGLAIFDENRTLITRYPLPDRGHATASSHRSQYIVVFARRPGNFALAIDRTQQTAPVLFTSPEYSHFYGHGTFSYDGKLLFATENNFDQGTGLIGVYEVDNHFRRLGEFPSYGVGPHELCIMADGRTLCIANGGIETHPDNGRFGLNLHTMQSSVAFVDSRDAGLRAIFQVPRKIHRLSLRHMAVDSRSNVWLGGQYQGNKRDSVSLIATANLEQGLTFADIDPRMTNHLQHYIGSVAVSRDREQVAMTSPRGNSLIVIDAGTKRVLRKCSIEQVCGVSPSYSRGGFMTTSMVGEMYGQETLYWDNHVQLLLTTTNQAQEISLPSRR